jgi:hypothetical protein
MPADGDFWKEIERAREQIGDLLGQRCGHQRRNTAIAGVHRGVAGRNQKRGPEISSERPAQTVRVQYSAVACNLRGKRAYCGCDGVRHFEAHCCYPTRMSARPDTMA